MNLKQKKVKTDKINGEIFVRLKKKPYLCNVIRNLV